MSFSLKRLYAFKDEEKKGATGISSSSSSSSSGTLNKPLIPDPTANKFTFSGQQYGYTDDRTFYTISDRIGRNYTPTSAGISVSNVRNILKGKATFQMPDFVDSNIISHRPLNVKSPKHIPTYNSKEMNRSISNGSLDILHSSLSKKRMDDGSSSMYTIDEEKKRTIRHSWIDPSLSDDVSLSKFNNSLKNGEGWLPNALATPRPEPRLFTETGEIPTDSISGRPIRRILKRENDNIGQMVVDASTPFDIEIKDIYSKVESSSNQYMKFTENIASIIKREKSQLHSISDTQMRREWMGRALSMVRGNV